MKENINIHVLTDAQLEQLKKDIENIVRQVINEPPEPFSDYPELMKREQVAEMLGIAPGTVSQWSSGANRILHKHRIGTSVRWKKSEVLAAVKQHGKLGKGRSKWSK